MNKKIFFRAILTWFLFIPLAILNGIIRNNYYQLLLGELLAHQLSTLIACILFLFLVYIIWKGILANLNNKILLQIGLLWLLLTIIFEFVFGHYIVGHSWQHLLADYNIFQGRVWILFLINSTVAPLIIKHFQA